MAKLTARERKLLRFAQEYLIDFNGARAARAVGSKESRAKNDASLWLQDPFVKEELARLMKEREEQSRVKAFRVLEELAIIAFADISHYIIDDNGVVELADDAPPDAMRAVAKIKRKRREIYKDDGEPIVEIDTELALWDKNTALTNALKHLGMLRDKLEVTGKEGAPLTFTLALGDGKPVGE